MKTKLNHESIKGIKISLKDLNGEEQEILRDLYSYFESEPDWNDFSNFWPSKVVAYYDAKGQARQVTVHCTLFRVAQDLATRIGVEQGRIRKPNPFTDYREQIEHIIREKFSTQRSFCQETGISEDLLSHVLAGRKHLGMDTLTHALERIGYRLQIVPVNGKKSAADKSA